MANTANTNTYGRLVVNIIGLLSNLYGFSFMLSLTSDVLGYGGMFQVHFSSPSIQESRILTWSCSSSPLLAWHSPLLRLPSRSFVSSFLALLEVKALAYWPKNTQLYWTVISTRSSPLRLAALYKFVVYVATPVSERKSANNAPLLIQIWLDGGFNYAAVLAHDLLQQGPSSGRRHAFCAAVVSWYVDALLACFSIVCRLLSVWCRLWAIPGPHRRHLYLYIGLPWMDNLVFLTQWFLGLPFPRWFQSHDPCHVLYLLRQCVRCHVRSRYVCRVTKKKIILVIDAFYSGAFVHSKLQVRRMIDEHRKKQ